MTLGKSVAVLSILAVSFVLLGVLPAAAGEKREPPLSYSGGLKKLSAVPVLTLPAVDRRSLLREVEASAKIAPGPMRIALPADVAVTPSDHGLWEAAPAGGRVWRLRVFSDGATDLSFGFTRYFMPKGARLYVMSGTENYFRGPYTEKDNYEHHQLWTPVIPGGAGTIELYVPDGTDGEPELELTRVGCGYRDLFHRQGAEKAGSCNIDVICPEGDAWRDQIQSVAVYEVSGFLECTGTMVNNTANDFKPYFETANHCGIDATNAASVVAYWNFFSPTCGAHGGGNLNDASVGGTVFRANYGVSDFCLVEFVNMPDPGYNVYWAGWDRTGADPPGAVGIHHPNCDEKSISFEDDPLTTTSYLQTAVPGDGSHYRVGAWDARTSGHGITEPGSSGSPLFNPQKRLVGQLHGGYSACTALDQPDWYGKLGMSWTGGGTDATRLSNWLDPGGTGVDFYDGAFQPPPCRGTVTLDAAKYNCDDTITITVKDGQLAGAGTQRVSVWSTFEGTPVAPAEQPNLVETPANSAQFVGTVRTAAVSTGGDGAVGVRNGDTITVRYVDADYCGTPNVNVDTTAAADCLEPVISNVKAVSITGRTAVITWDTNEPADSRVSYGTTPPAWSNAGDGNYTASHSVPLSGLTPCTTYYFWVASADGAGNSASEDNGGSYFTFTTGVDVQPTYPSTGGPIPIPDNNPTGIRSTIVVPDNKVVQDVDVTVNITHAFDADLTIYLIAPGGIQIELFENSTGMLGFGQDFTDTIFDDEAATPITSGTPPFTGRFIPLQPLAAADGIIAAGAWTLWVYDHEDLDTGTLDSWSLTLTYPPQQCGPHARYESHALVADFCSGGGAGSGDGIWDPGEQVQFSVTVENDGEQALTGVGATITPLTAGVVMMDDTASFGDLPVFGSAVSAPPSFAAQLPLGFACGDTIDFQVNIGSTSPARNWTETFSQAIGNVIPGGAVLLDEGFEAGFPPSGWGSYETGDASGPGWQLGNTGTVDSYGNPHSGSFFAWNNDDDLPGDAVNWLVTPRLTIPAGAAGAELTFWQRDYWQAGYYQYHGVWVTTGASPDPSVSTYTEVWTGDTNDPWVQQAIDLGAYAGQSVYLAFRYEGDFNDEWYIDDVHVAWTGLGGCTMNPCDGGSGMPEVSDDTAHYMKLAKNGDRVDIRFENVGAEDYNLYVSNARETHPLHVANPASGKVDCRVAGAVGIAGGMLELSGYDPASGITGSTSQLFLLVTGVDDPGTEGPLGDFRTADANCNN